MAKEREEKRSWESADTILLGSVMIFVCLSKLCSPSQLLLYATFPAVAFRTHEFLSGISAVARKQQLTPSPQPFPLFRFSTFHPAFALSGKLEIVSMQFS